jgi:hypothetical protein
MVDLNTSGFFGSAFRDQVLASAVVMYEAA